MSIMSVVRRSNGFRYTPQIQCLETLECKSHRISIRILPHKGSYVCRGFPKKTVDSPTMSYCSPIFVVDRPSVGGFPAIESEPRPSFSSALG